MLLHWPSPLKMEVSVKRLFALLVLFILMNHTWKLLACRHFSEKDHCKLILLWVLFCCDPFYIFCVEFKVAVLPLYKFEKVKVVEFVCIINKAYTQLQCSSEWVDSLYWLHHFSPPSHCHAHLSFPQCSITHLSHIPIQNTSSHRWWDSYCHLLYIYFIHYCFRHEV